VAELTKCKTCGKEVSKTAPVCPHCGENLPGLHIKCPNCGSMNIRTGQKGFDTGKAFVGSILGGPVGLMWGMKGRKKIEFVCQACNHKWKPDPKDFA